MGSPSVCSHQATGGELYSGIAQSCARLTGQTSGLPQILSYQRPSRSRPLIPDGFHHFEGTARSLLVCPAFLGSDSYAPSDSCEDLGPFVGLSLPSSPLPFACLSGDAPWHASATHHILAAGFFRMTPFRSMLLTVQSGLHRLAPWAQSVPAYAQVLRHSSIALARRTRILW